MLTITPNAAEAVRGLVAGSPAGGLRIAAAEPTPEGTPMQVTLVEAGAATDETVDADGAKVFVAAEAAPFLDDKVLDAELADDKVRFSLADAGTG